MPAVAVQENDTGWPTSAGSGLWLADALRGGGLILEVFWKVTEVEPNTFDMRRRNRKGEIRVVASRNFGTT